MSYTKELFRQYNQLVKELLIRRKRYQLNSIIKGLSILLSDDHQERPTGRKLKTTLLNLKCVHDVFIGKSTNDINPSNRSQHIFYDPNFMKKLEKAISKKNNDIDLVNGISLAGLVGDYYERYNIKVPSLEAFVSFFNLIFLLG